MTIAPPQTFRLQVLGAPSIRDGDGVTPPALGWGKPLALLCLLAVRHEARRDEVVDLLWRDVEETKARNAFRQALHRLRTALGDELIPQDRERLRLVRSDRLAVDLDQFEAAVGAGRLDDALRFYTGDFLEKATLDVPPFDLWAENERTRLIAVFRQALRDSVTQASAAGRWLDAISGARRLLAAAPFEASAAELAATTLVSAGRRTDAQELLRQFGTHLEKELGLPMPPELQTLLGRIERQHERVPNVGAKTSTVPPIPGELQLSFVGREAELSKLLTLFRSTGDDASALVLLEGPSGIGKSRLARELALHAKSLGPATVLTGRDRPGGAAIPLRIFADALRPLVRASGVVGASRHLLAEAARLLPELRDEFDLPALADVEDEAARLRFFEGVAALIDAAAFEQPILLVLEDLQFIGTSSLDLLAYLCVRLAGSAVMFVLTVRPDDAPPAALGRLRALSQASATSAPPHGSRALTIVLTSLSAADARLAATRASGSAAVSDAVLQRVVQRADGSPARLTELLRRALAGEDVAALPIAMRDLISERLERLSSGQRRLFLVLALVGRPATVGFAVAATHLPEKAVRESLDLLRAQGLVERTADERFVASDIAATEALESAGAASRAFLSGWIAEALTREAGTTTAELARFFAAAGQAAPAFEYSRRAAYDALALGGVAEAVLFLSSARTFAATTEQQSEIESLLTSLGSGRRRLVSRAAESPPVEAGTAERPVRAAVSSPPPAPGAPAARWERLFPNWRLLLGAAVATLVISTIVLAPQSSALLPAARTPSTDTLLVSDAETGRGVRYVTGDLASGFMISERVTAGPSDPPWLDSLARPWVNAIASPRGLNVALARIGAAGSDVYVIGADRRDTTAVVTNRGDAQPLGWSPDGRWLLVLAGRTLPNETFDADLFAHRVGGPPEIRPVDSTARRAVTEAAWSPDGSRIAWVARVGDERQLEVFTSLADGSEVQNVSRHPADDYHIAWSNDGELLAFTSVRDGNAELYASAVRENRLWRLTRDAAQDDKGRFSRNGRLIAFESTRGGAPRVYVMPSLGGEARLVESSRPLSILRWLGGATRYVDRVHVNVANHLQPGDTTAAIITALDQFDEPADARGAQWIVLDSAYARLLPPLDSTDESRRLVARRSGLARVVASVGRWRFDTAFVRIGAQSVVLLDASLANPLSAWRPLGIPAPTMSGTSIVLNADREWESGVLSRSSVPLVPGLSFRAVVDAPFQSARDPATSVSMALVAPEEPVAIDATAPQFLRYASVSWNADGGRLVYAVGREVFSEPIAVLGTLSAAAVRMRVELDSTMSFTIGGVPRWRSTLRVIDSRRDARVHAWIAGRATGDRVRVAGAALLLATPDSASGR